MSATPRTDELAEVASVMSDEEAIREWQRLACALERENAALREDSEMLDWLQRRQAGIVLADGRWLMQSVPWDVREAIRAEMEKEVK
jgi:hypothetical protein